MTSKQFKQSCAEKFKRFQRTSIGTRKIALTVSATVIMWVPTLRLSWETRGR